MFELGFSKSTWSKEAAEKLTTMGEIAQTVEDKKLKMKCTETKTTRFGNHFIECMWANPDATYGPDCCVCSDIKHREYQFIKLLESIGPNECGEEMYNRLMRELKESTLKTVGETSAHTL